MRHVREVAARPETGRAGRRMNAAMTTPSRPRMTGIGRVLVIVYAIMALAATGRSFVQIVREFDEAPVAYTLSALAAVVYILATLALIFAGRRGWYLVAWSVRFSSSFCILERNSVSRGGSVLSTCRRRAWPMTS